MKFQSTIRLIAALLAAVPAAILLVPAFVIGCSLALFAAAVRATARLFEPRFVSWQELMSFDAALGWKPRPNLSTRYLADRDDVFHVVTDANGWPGAGTVDDSDVVVVGDSFAFGYGVNSGQTFADLTKGVSVKALGAPGYNMTQGVLLIEQFADLLGGKLVVWFICLENDLQDNLSPAMRHYRSPFVRPRTNGSWEIVRNHVSPKPWRCSEPDKRRILAHLCVPGPVADRVFDACDFLIAHGAAVCRAAGTSLAVVTIPDPSQLSPAGVAALTTQSGDAERFDENLPDRRIAEICHRHGVHAVIGKQHLTRSDYKVYEALHWNERGHRRVGEVLAQLYESYRSGEMYGASLSQMAAVNRRVAGVQHSRVVSA